MQIFTSIFMQIYTKYIAHSLELCLTNSLSPILSTCYFTKETHDGKTFKGIGLCGR